MTGADRDLNLTSPAEPVGPGLLEQPFVLRSFRETAKAYTARTGEKIEHWEVKAIVHRVEEKLRAALGQEARDRGLIGEGVD